MLFKRNDQGKSQNTSTKVRALLAGGLVLGVGAAFTLAAWTDNEWVFGNTGGSDGPGNPGTGTYQMQQNTFSNTAGTGADAWSDQPTANGGGLTFSVGAKDLQPGSTVYAPMQLRAVAGSKALAATLAQGVQAADADVAGSNSTALYSALTYEVKVGVTPANCSSIGAMAGGTNLVPAGSALTTNAAADTINLPAGVAAATPGAAVDICFAITLPAGVTDVTLQGKNTIPSWRFTSIVGS